MGRGIELLAAAARAFEDYQDPFCQHWLSLHEVTADECMDLSGHVAESIYAWLALPMEQKAALMAERLLADRQEGDDG